MRIVIVDDEVPARSGLKAVLAGLPMVVQVVGEAATAAEAKQLLQEIRPDVVLLDIWLGDGTGFDVLEGTDLPDMHVIFITAFDQFAVKAFKQGALHYLLKPVGRTDLHEALLRATKAPPTPADRFRVLRSLALERITIPAVDGFHVLAPKEIIRCESDGNYTRLFLLGGERLVASRTLKEFEGLLMEHGFFRVHLSHVVNLEQVRKYLHREGGMLVLANGDHVPVSHRRKTELMEALGRRGGKMAFPDNGQ